MRARARTGVGGVGAEPVGMRITLREPNAKGQGSELARRIA
jgi:hypothetical protein